MIGLKINKKNAERLRRFMVKHDLFNPQYKILKSKDFIYFPISQRDSSYIEDVRRLYGAEIAEVDFERSPKIQSYREILAKRLGDATLSNATKRYDLLGNIAVIDSDDSSLARRLAKTIMEVNKNVSTVIRKGGAVSGLYRTRKYYYVMGKRNYIAVYKENGATFRFDVRKVFFSPRLAYERKRISEAAGDGENVMVMFAGVGPFAIEIAKAHRSSNVVAVELNKYAYSYMLENIRLNRLENVVAVHGDVRKVANNYKGFADRIVMPLPKSSSAFLESVEKVARNGCIVHYYTFGSAKSAVADSKRLIRNFFSDRNKKVKFIGDRVVRPYSAEEVEVVIDFKLSDGKAHTVHLSRTQKDI